jgi:proteic killer suppression protein
MIVGFAARGLEIFHRTGLTTGVQPRHAGKLARVLAALDAAAAPGDLDLPGFQLRADKQRSGGWSIRATGDWLVTFDFAGPGVDRVDHVPHG